MPRSVLNPLMYRNLWKHDILLTTAGSTTVKIPRGIYEIVVRGAGGCGGQSTNVNGGAGGKGLLSRTVITVPFTTVGTGTVGAGGITRANGGNGGSKGDGTDAPQNPGDGGGGGHASLFTINGSVYGANGGGGGGGGGGSDTNGGRYSDGASGGGGGGYYRLNADGTETSVPGQKGGKGFVHTH